MLIGLYESPPDADAEFLARRGAGTPGATLLRALRRDVRFRFAELGPGGSYKVVRSAGAPDTAGGVVGVEPFDVAAADDGRFLAAWDAAAPVHAAQQGHIGARLCRGGDGDAFRWVAVARWSSPLMVARAAARPDFAAAAPPFPSYPALYLPVG
jgi:hypothetical protein